MLRDVSFRLVAGRLCGQRGAAIDTGHRQPLCGDGQQSPTGLGVPDELRNAAAGEKRPSRNGGFWESPSGS